LYRTLRLWNASGCPEQGDFFDSAKIIVVLETGKSSLIQVYFPKNRDFAIYAFRRILCAHLGKYV
jgi:hypothetical protein